MESSSSLISSVCKTAPLQPNRVTKILYLGIVLSKMTQLKNPEKRFVDVTCYTQLLTFQWTTLILHNSLHSATSSDDSKVCPVVHTQRCSKNTVKNMRSKFSSEASPLSRRKLFVSVFVYKTVNERMAQILLNACSEHVLGWVQTWDRTDHWKSWTESSKLP